MIDKMPILPTKKRAAKSLRGFSYNKLMLMPMMRLGNFIVLVMARFHEDRCGDVAQALSYTTLLSIVPLTTVTFAILSAFPVFQVWMNTIQAFIYSHFVPASGDVVQKYLLQFANKSTQLTVVGLVFLIVTALMLMATIERSFNLIWRAPHHRKLMYRFLTYWAILTLGPILVGASLSLTSYFMSLRLFSESAPILGGFKHFMLSGLPFFLEILAFMLLYIVVPNVYVKPRHAFAGSLFAAILFEIAKRSFAFFVLHYSSYRMIYGAIATLPVFLIWIYLSWMVILLGAVVVAVMPQWRALRHVPERA